MERSVGCSFPHQEYLHWSINFGFPGENWLPANLLWSNYTLLRNLLPGLIPQRPVGNDILSIDATRRTVVREIGYHHHYCVSLTAFPNDHPLTLREVHM